MDFPTGIQPLVRVLIGYKMETDTGQQCLVSFGRGRLGQPMNSAADTEALESDSTMTTARSEQPNLN